MPIEILIDGVIGTGKGQISSSAVRAMLPENNEPIEVKIHSEGGSVVEGFRIFDLFSAYQGPKKAIIESAAYSIASFIPMAFDEVEITPNGYMMIHNPYMGVEGDDEELAKTAATLSKMKQNMIDAYAKKTGKTQDEITGILKQETYLNATEAVAMGFCNRITSQSVYGRVFAKLDNMPHGVVAALFGAGSGGNTEPQKEKPMSDSTPVAASIDEIETAFPKMKPATILACLKKQMPMASVATAAVEELMQENASLQARISAMEEEMTASAMEVEDTPAEPAAEGEDEPVAMEEEDEPAAKASGVKPVAKAKTSQVKSASAKWKTEVTAKISGGLDRHKAILAADRDNPGLREQMLAEANS